MKRLLLLALSILECNAANYYVDSSASGSGTGLSWVDAWTNVNAVLGVAGGDTVYISGGATTNSYYLSSSWSPKGGVGAVITYSIAQEEGRNGMAIFYGTTNDFVSGAITNVVISGDAGDGMPHILLSGFSYAFHGDYSQGVRFSYIDCGGRTNAFRFNPASGLEIDHCAVTKVDGGQDYVIYLANSVAEWDNTKIHHNTINVPNKLGATGTGDDAIQNAGTGVSIFNNVIVGYSTNYSGSQHQDGLQPLAGNYLKIYNNEFRNIGNYPIFCDAYSGDFTHIRIFNNIMALTDLNIQTNSAPQGIAFGPDGGAFANLGRWPLFDDIVIANNTVVDYAEHSAIKLKNNSGQSAIFTNCVVANNVSVNSGTITSEASVTNLSNMQISADSASTNFVSYSTLQATNNYQLVLGSTLIGGGVDLSGFFTTDFTGATRTGTWDIGAYELDAESAPETDTTAPSIAVTSPSSTNRWHVTLTGTAADNVGVDHVTVTVNGVLLGNATGTTSWSIAANLREGPNAVIATAYDAALNASVTNTIITFTPNPRVSLNGIRAVGGQLRSN